MNPDAIAALLTWMSLIIAFVAAGFWLKAAKVVVRHGDPGSTGTVFVEGVDVQSTVREQGRWNSRAALATAVALVAQALSQGISNGDLILDVMR